MHYGRHRLSRVNPQGPGYSLPERHRHASKGAWRGGVTFPRGWGAGQDEVSPSWVSLSRGSAWFVVFFVELFRHKHEFGVGFEPKLSGILAQLLDLA